MLSMAWHWKGGSWKQTGLKQHLFPGRKPGRKLTCTEMGEEYLLLIMVSILTLSSNKGWRPVPWQGKGCLVLSPGILGAPASILAQSAKKLPASNYTKHTRSRPSAYPQGLTLELQQRTSDPQVLSLKLTPECGNLSQLQTWLVPCLGLCCLAMNWWVESMFTEASPLSD